MVWDVGAAIVRLHQCPGQGDDGKLSPKYAEQHTTWRYRIGDWRFFFSIDDGKQIVSMLAADHRSRAY
ncbi:MAG TPA: type II toxin-antitoxin system RelE/ParE family toxin [Thermoanaerobaculia bacterium]|nr:type II toxin-antitoxin system RelE/ParE family toxin [Thermoanaerobaculia bacterium]